MSAQIQTKADAESFLSELQSLLEQPSQLEAKCQQLKEFTRDDDIQLLLLEAKGWIVVTKILDTHLGKSKLVLLAIQILANLACGDAIGSEEILDASFQSVLKGVKEHKADSAILSAAFAFIQNLTAVSEEKCQQIMCWSGGLELILNALQQSNEEKNQPIFLSALRTLVSLTYSLIDECQNQLFEKKGIQLLLSAIDTFQSFPNTLSWIVTALYNICACNDLTTKLFVESNGLEKLMTLFSTFAENQEIIEEILKLLLAFCIGSWKDVVIAVGLDCVVIAMINHGENIDVCQCGTKIIQQALFDRAQVRQWLVTSEFGLMTLIGVVKRFESVEMIVETIVQIFWNLSKDPAIWAGIKDEMKPLIQSAVTNLSTKYQDHEKISVWLQDILDKPWDTNDIDHWKDDGVKQEDGLPPPLEESTFATLFPAYREQYLRDSWPLVTRTLKKHGINCELNLIEGSMSVSTTRKMWDPYAIIKARDLIKLLARSIPVNQALKIMENDMFCDIIKIKNLVRNKERFVKRRQRLIGPNGCTLKAMELVTQCYIMVQGNTVSAMGTIKGLKWVRKIVEDCMNNIHPIYNIKQFMIKRQLEQDPEYKDHNWDRFLPSFKSKNVKKKSKPIEKKPYNPFPPEQTPRKIDYQLESGEYFLKEEQKRAKARVEKQGKQSEKQMAKKKKKDAEFVPPEEVSVVPKKEEFDVAAIKSNIQKLTKKRKEAPSAEPVKKKAKK